MNNDTKYLNVDEIVPKVRKVVTIKGEQYEFQTPTVKDFLDEMKRIQKMQAEHKADGDMDSAESMALMVQSMQHSISTSFPTMKPATLNALTYEQIAAIRNFIAEQLDEESVDAENEAGNE